MDVSVIIVNYNTAGQVADCINSLCKLTTGITFEVIVVDNNSNEDYERIIRSNVSYKNITFLTLEKNVGFGMANNAGFKLASGRNILCLNPDTILLNNAVRILSDYLDSNPDVGACGGNLYDSAMRPAYSFRRIQPGIWFELNDLAFRKPEKLIYGKNFQFNHTDSPLSVAMSSGADLMMPAYVVRQIGGFSPEFFMYFEDCDLCRKIIRTGKRIMNVPSAKIQHLEGSSFDNPISPTRLKLVEQARLAYYRRNCNRFEIAVSDLIYKAMLSLKCRIFHEEAMMFRKACFSELCLNRSGGKSPDNTAVRR